LDIILARRPAVEHIVIETSGLALPKPLVQAFHWPAIKSRVTVDGVVAVVDGPALAAGRVAADLDALARQRKPTPRSITTIPSRKYSTIRSPAPTWSCSTSAT
jgi:cobalamin biosynthesis protein CobW